MYLQKSWLDTALWLSIAGLQYIRCRSDWADDKGGTFSQLDRHMEVASC
jgi:hypothetical protein